MNTAVLTAWMIWTGVVACPSEGQSIDWADETIAAGDFFSGDDTAGEVKKLSQQLRAKDQQVATLNRSVELWQKRAVQFSLECESHEEQLNSALQKTQVEINELKKSEYQKKRESGERAEVTITPTPFQSMPLE
jgi:ElaB/YqjD/DUF883 family membrane-anchored ribosome-binding protein